ncbi:MAG: ACT domain-containing protein, partial [Spirochaetes bacterium]|nr:ACT domain-containing protein [Spirochaetota bacterium]
NINVDMIVQSTSPDGKTNSISFTVKKKDLTKVKGIMQELKKRNHAGSFSINQKIGIVSIVGVGMKSHAGIAGKMFDVLAKSKINIEMISTSEIKISVVIEETKVIKAMNIIHKAFDLN